MVPKSVGGLEGGLVFLDLRMVTFSNLMESMGRVEGKRGDLSKNTERGLRSEGSIKEGESLGLANEGSTGLGEVLVRGGKSSKVDKGGEVKGAKIGKVLEG